MYVKTCFRFSFFYWGFFPLISVIRQVNSPTFKQLIAVKTDLCRIISEFDSFSEILPNRNGRHEKNSRRSLKKKKISDERGFIKSFKHCS